MITRKVIYLTHKNTYQSVIYVRFLKKMKIVARNLDGSAIFTIDHYHFTPDPRFSFCDFLPGNTFLPLIVTEKDEFFTKLAKKEITLTITRESSETFEYSCISEDNTKKLNINSSDINSSDINSSERIEIDFYNCYDIAGQIYIKHYTNIELNYNVAHYAITNPFNYNYVTEFPVLNKIVTHLQIHCSSYNIGEDCEYFNNLPTDLKVLSVIIEGNINCHLNNLPLLLKCFYIKRHSMKYPIENIIAGLKCFKLECKQYNFILDLPLNLEHCEIYCDDYSHGAEHVPDSVVALGITYKSIKTLDKVPKNCKILGYVGCPDKLYNDLITQNLGVIISKSKFVFKIYNSKIHMCCLD